MKKLYWGFGDNAGTGSDETDNCTIETVNNHIYFYSAIDTQSVLNLIKAIREATDQMVIDARKAGFENPLLFLHINSPGGSVLDGFAAMDAILTNEIPIVTIVDGIAASTGTFLTIVGKERWINKHAYMLIHQISSGYWGKYNEHKDAMRNMDSLMQNLKDMYKEYTTLPNKMLEEILSHDFYFDADTCLKYGFVDKVLS